MSVLVYIAYMWFSNYWKGAMVYQSVIELHFSYLFWLTIILVGGGVFCADLLIEFCRLQHNKNGSDYVRELLETKKGLGWNDENKEIQITELDLDNINNFMKPIEAELRNKDLKRQQYLDEQRLIKTRKLANGGH